MKKSFLSLLVLVVSFFAFPEVSEACVQKLEPSKKVVKKGDKVTVKASIKWIHHPCELEPDDLNFKFIGVKKLSISKWKKKGRGKFEAVLKIKITSSKKAVIKMWKECSRSGKHGTELKFKFKKK
ncbi:MAG: hypothetical protein ACQES9_11130 [Myxococcota bacterium]